VEHLTALLDDRNKEIVYFEILHEEPMKSASEALRKAFQQPGIPPLKEITTDNRGDVFRSGSYPELWGNASSDTTMHGSPEGFLKTLEEGSDGWNLVFPAQCGTQSRPKN
jgi:hypothetical protein